MARLKISDSHSMPMPKGMDELIDGLLLEASRIVQFNPDLIEGTVGKQIHGDPHSKGVTGVMPVSTNAVSLRAQPGDNATRFVVLICVPQGVSQDAMVSACKVAAQKISPSATDAPELDPLTVDLGSKATGKVAELQRLAKFAIEANQKRILLNGRLEEAKDVKEKARLRKLECQQALDESERQLKEATTRYADLERERSDLEKSIPDGAMEAEEKLNKLLELLK